MKVPNEGGDMEVTVNYWAVLVAGLSSMLVGSLWYAQGGFGKTWAKLAKVNLNKKMSNNQMAWLLGGTFVVSLVTAFVLAHVSFLAHKFFDDTFLWVSLSTAFWLWLGLVAARLYTHDSFEGRPWKLTALNAAHELVTLLVMGAIIGLMGY